MRKYKTKALAALAAAMAALTALSGCAAGNDAAPAQTGPQAIEVHTTTAGYGTIDRQTQFVGRVEAAESVKVYATTSAKVITANGAPGERVEKGQLLFALDTEMLEIAAETARLQYEASVSGADINITSAKKAYDNARDSYVDLYDARFELREDREGAESAMKQTRAAYDAASKALENYLAELASKGIDISGADGSNNQGGSLDSAKEELAAARENAYNAMNQAKKAMEAYSASQADDWVSENDNNYLALVEAYSTTLAIYEQLNAQYEAIDKNQADKWDPEKDPTYIALVLKKTETGQAYQTAAAAYQQLDAAYEQIDEQVDNVRDTVSTLRDTYKNTAGDEEAGIVGTVQSQVDLAKISYDNAMKNLNDATVYAPVSGVISAKSVSVSDFASPGMPLYVIEPEGGAPMVSFNLSEDGANALSVGSPVTVIYNGMEYPAQITELAHTANPQTGLYAAKAQTEEALPTSRSGGVVKVQASTAKAENALLLSLDLLEYDGNQPYVYVYRDGAAARADLVTGISSADDVVILSGITAEDRIITTWHPDLKDGAAVTLAE